MYGAKYKTVMQNKTTTSKKLTFLVEVNFLAEQQP